MISGGSKHIYFSAEALEIIKDLKKGELSQICSKAIIKWKQQKRKR